MKILIVTHLYPIKEYPYFGVCVAEQMEAIRRRHPDVEFTLYYIEWMRGMREYFKSIYKVRQTIRRGHFDLVHIHFGADGFYLLWPFGRGAKTLVTFTGGDIQPEAGNGWLENFVSRNTARRSDMCIVLNPDMDRRVKALCPNTALIPYSMDMDVFVPTSRTVNDGRKHIVFPSDPARTVKDYPLFCRVLGILRDKYRIVVEGHILKGLTRTGVARLYSNSDLLLMTSISEGAPVAVAEALCCNLPCVSTPVGNLTTLIGGVKDCYVAHSRDAEELAALAAKSLAGGGEGLSGREQIFRLHLDGDSIADKVYDIYTKLISEGSGDS